MKLKGNLFIDYKMPDLIILSSHLEWVGQFYVGERKVERQTDQSANCPSGPIEIQYTILIYQAQKTRQWYQQ